MFGRKRREAERMERVKLAGEALAEGIQVGIDAAKEFDEAEDWAEDMAKKVDEAFSTEPEPKKKDKKKKKTADEKFEELGLKKTVEGTNIIRYKSDNTMVAIHRPAGGDYVAKVTKPDGNSAVWMSDRMIKAIRRKAKEKGWR